MTSWGQWVLYNDHITLEWGSPLTLDEWLVIIGGIALKPLYFAFKWLIGALWGLADRVYRGPGSKDVYRAF